MTPDAATIPMQGPAPLRLTGLELRRALALYVGYAPESVDQIHATFVHPENTLGFVLEDADLIDISFKPFPHEDGTNAKLFG